MRVKRFESIQIFVTTIFKQFVDLTRLFILSFITISKRA